MPRIPDAILSVIEDAYGPVAADFRVRQTPQGDAPDYIRDQWVDMTLPVRRRHLGAAAICYTDRLSGEDKEVGSPVIVTGIEAVQALHEAGRVDAATFWAMFEPEILVFRAHEGELRPLE
jgi:hypothetical protein